MEIPPHEATLIQGLAWLSFLSATYGTLLGHGYVAGWAYVVWLSTLVYWTSPAVGWRRIMDLVCVSCALSVHLWAAWSSRYWLAYYGLTGLGVLCFPVGHHLHASGRISEGMAIHGLLHVLANAGNFIMYAGLPAPTYN